MLVAKLKLVRRKDCFIAVPAEFFLHEPILMEYKNALLRLKTLNGKCSIYVSWDGISRTQTDDYEIDTDFATANHLKNGDTVIVEVAEIKNITSCEHFCVAPVDEHEGEMLEVKSTFIEENLLAKVLYIQEGLNIPIWLSANVCVIVKVHSTQPSNNKQTALHLTNRTELQLLNCNNLSTISPNNENIRYISDRELTFLDLSLGIREEKQMQYGAMLVCGPKGSGKTHFLKQVARHYTSKVANIVLNCKDICDVKPEILKNHLLGNAKSALEKQPAILCIEGVDTFLRYDSIHEGERGFESLKRICYVDAFLRLIKFFERQKSSSQPRVALIFTSSIPYSSLNPKFIDVKSRKYINFIKTISEPGDEKRMELLKDNIDSHRSPEINFNLSDEEMKQIVSKTKSYSPLDFRLVIESSLLEASLNHVDNNEHLNVKANDIIECVNRHTPLRLRGVDLKQKSSRTFASIGGMHEAKRQLTRIILLPLKYPSLFKQVSIRLQTHILLHGPSGCGKTLIAEAIANEQNLNFLSVKGPELFSKYIGGSEAAIRDLFERAQAAVPCVLLFDEFDSIAPKRGHDSTGVTDRVVNQLLSLLDGVDRLKQGLHIIATTSRIDMIDAALLRPGRLDCHIYCGLPNDIERHEILATLAEKVALTDKVDLEVWSKRLEYFSGADIRSLLYSAQLKSLRSKIETHTKPMSKAEKEQIKIIVDNEHLQKCYEEMLPSVIHRYKRENSITNRRLATVNGQKFMQIAEPRVTLA